MLTPFDFTLAAQSATRWVVSFAAWIPLSVNFTKLMYVAMMSPLSILGVGFDSNEIELSLRIPIPSVKRKGNNNRLKWQREESLDQVISLRLRLLLTCQNSSSAARRMNLLTI